MVEELLKSNISFQGKLDDLLGLFRDLKQPICKVVYFQWFFVLFFIKILDVLFEVKCAAFPTFLERHEAEQ